MKKPGTERLSNLSVVTQPRSWDLNSALQSTFLTTTLLQDDVEISCHIYFCIHNCGEKDGSSPQILVDLRCNGTKQKLNPSPWGGSQRASQAHHSLAGWTSANSSPALCPQASSVSALHTFRPPALRQTIPSATGVLCPEPLFSCVKTQPQGHLLENLFCPSF